MNVCLETSAFTLNRLSPKEIMELEAEGKLIRALRPDIKRRVLYVLAKSGDNPHPYVLECDGLVYLSIMGIEDEAQRKRAYRLIQQFQIGVEVDLSSLPAALHEILQPEHHRSRLLSYALVLGGICGTVIGVMAMAISVLAIALTDLLLGTSLDEFGGMQITAVSFVIFTVLGWIVTTPFIQRRLNQ